MARSATPTELSRYKQRRREQQELQQALKSHVMLIYLHAAGARNRASDLGDTARAKRMKAWADRAQAELRKLRDQA
jgi:hypothetical protein